MIDTIAAATEPDAREKTPGPVIAVIEDGAQIRRFLRATLVNQGYRCFEATTGAEGLVIASSRQPDLVPLDLALRGALRVDLAQRRLFVRDAEVRLTPTEYRLLTTLIRHASKVPTHRQLLKEVWGPHLVDQPHYLRVYMLQLRRKLEVDPARLKLLLTEPGVGYRFAAE